MAATEQTNKILKKLSPYRATGADKIPPKTVILSANIVDCYLANIINHDIDNNIFFGGAKIAAGPYYLQKRVRDKIENYKPVNILNCFSKVYERFLHEQLKPFVETFLPVFVAAYREGYSCNHALMRLVENWKRLATLLKKRLWQRCFPVNFVKFLKTFFLQNTSGRLLLKQFHEQALQVLC